MKKQTDKTETFWSAKTEIRTFENAIDDKAGPRQAFATPYVWVITIKIGSAHWILFEAEVVYNVTIKVGTVHYVALFFSRLGLVLGLKLSRSEVRIMDKKKYT